MDIPLKFLKRLLAMLCLLAALIVSITLGTGYYLSPRDNPQKSDAIVVVSGGDNNQRTDEGVRLWKAEWAPLLIFAGAAADGGTSNAAVMAARAVGQGVPDDRILVEERSTTTKENALFTKPLLDSRQVRSAILVSSPYHTRRVKTNFEKTYGKEYRFLIRPATDTQWARSSWWQSAATTELTVSEVQKTLYVLFLQK